MIDSCNRYDAEPKQTKKHQHSKYMGDKGRYENYLEV